MGRGQRRANPKQPYANAGEATATLISGGEVASAHEKGCRGPQSPGQSQGITANESDAGPAFKTAKGGYHQKQGHQP